MDIETLKWLAGTLVLPSLTFGVVVIYLLRDIKKSSDQLLHMHHHPDDYDFGTNELTKIAKDQKTSIRDLVHYIRWQAKEATGKEPPPRISRD